MFAVPGWSVDSSQLKPQDQDLSKSSTKGPASSVSDPALPNKSNKKRKRSKAAQVSKDNLADLWESVIEGKPKSKDQAKDAKHSSKRQKTSTHEKEADSRQHPEKHTTLGEDGTLKQKQKKDKKKNKAYDASSAEEPTTSAARVSNEALPNKPTTPLTPLQKAMRQKLVSARFRHLNQLLYTTPSAKSLELFQSNPEMFEEYHEGFRRQVEVWPENPVDAFVMELRQRGKKKHASQSKKDKKNPNNTQDPEIPALPRTAGICRIADLGCGDAKLAQQLQKDAKKLHLDIRSYDLQNPHPLITKADIANLPLEDASIDVAIFCLALMGTNWIDFVEEAFRVLRWKGELWVAEIKSRFGRVSNRRVEHSVGKRTKANTKANKGQEDGGEEGHDEGILAEIDGEENGKQETDISTFVEILRKRGFVLQGDKAVDSSNKMFVKMHFVKGLTPVKGKCVPPSKGIEESGMETWKKKPKAKFLDPEDPSSSSEASALKPCVYKLR